MSGTPLNTILVRSRTAHTVIQLWAEGVGYNKVCVASTPLVAVPHWGTELSTR